MIIYVWPTGKLRCGRLRWPAQTTRCAIGWGGIKADKQEGDGVTPVGAFPLRRVFYRPDRLAKPLTELPVVPLTPHDGWCDTPTHPAYNTWIKRPFSARHERLWRTDSRYDVIVEVGYNDDPVVPHHGSAIFMHNAHPRYRPTAGCVALAQADLLALLRQCNERTKLSIGRRFY